METTQSNSSEYSETSRKNVLRQFVNSAVGEVAGFSVAIGAVYVTERLLPNQSKALVSHIAESLGKMRGLDSHSQQKLAKKIFDVGIMNVGGITSMGVQFGLRRIYQNPEEKTPIPYELGRLIVGRMVGTATAIGALATAHAHGEHIIQSAEKSINMKLADSIQSRRFSELLVSNAIQSVGAIAGNAPAQLLYDRLVKPPTKELSR